MRARLLGVGLLAAACAAVPAPIVEPHVPSPAKARAVQVPANTAPTPTPTSNATPTPDAARAASGSATVPSPAAPTPEPPQVVLEPPYSALGHARLATEMLTLGRDEELFQWALGGTSDPEHPSNRPGYHPATRVVIDVQLLSRAPKGTTHRLRRIARSTGYWPLRACFETAQRLAAKTERSARVRLTLGAAGNLLGARGLGPMPERDYARCVLERLRGLDFTPGFTRKLDVEISVKQWPGHAPAPPRAPDNAPAIHLPTDASAALEALTPTFTACYEKGLVDDAKLWGRIAFRLELAGDGAVQKAEPVETHFPSAAVVECARQAVLGARVSSPGVTELTFAVRLTQGGAPPAPATPLPESPAPPAPPAPH